MSEKRYHLNNKTHMVETPFDLNGLEWIKEIRRSKKEFKYQRIIDVIQCKPEKIEFGKLYELT